MLRNWRAAPFRISGTMVGSVPVKERSTALVPSRTRYDRPPVTAAAAATRDKIWRSTVTDSTWGSTRKEKPGPTTVSSGTPFAMAAPAASRSAYP